ncbi:hypothetical protein D3C85_793150 [compost metagenome]
MILPPAFFNSISFCKVASGIFLHTGIINDLKVPPGRLTFPFTTLASAIKLSEIKSTP